MRRYKWFYIPAFAILITALSWTIAPAQQVWTKCHITCRCLNDNSVGNFAFDIPIDKSPDIGFEADWACRVYGQRACSDGCNGLKYSYTYQTVSP